MLRKAYFAQSCSQPLVCETASRNDGAETS